MIKIYFLNNTVSLLHCYGLFLTWSILSEQPLSPKNLLSAHVIVVFMLPLSFIVLPYAVSRAMWRTYVLFACTPEGVIRKLLDFSVIASLHLFFFLIFGVGDPVVCSSIRRATVP